MKSRIAVYLFCGVFNGSVAVLVWSTYGDPMALFGNTLFSLLNFIVALTEIRELRSEAAE